MGGLRHIFFPQKIKISIVDKKTPFRVHFGTDSVLIGIWIALELSFTLSVGDNVNVILELIFVASLSLFVDDDIDTFS